MSPNETLDRAAVRSRRFLRVGWVALASIATVATACSGTVDGGFSAAGGDDPGAAFDPTELDAAAAPDAEAAPADAAGSTDGAPAPATDSGAKPADDAGTDGEGAAPPATDVAPPSSAAKTEYAPYFYTWGWNNSVYPFTSLVDMKKKTGLSAATLAFVVASSKTCNASRTVANHLADIDAFRALGGKVKASFGGASGTYLDAVCGTSTSLADAIGAFVDETGIDDLDFDVEQSGVMNATVNARRGAALKKVQDTRGAKISFTLAAYPASTSGKGGGMSSEAFEVVKAALAAGVTISHVNLMTMDYGSSYSSGRKMGDLAVSAVSGCVSQLKSLIPGLSDAKAYAMIGATPMIGQNDVSSEVFTLADAQTLAKFAREKHLGLVSFWAIQRDAPCIGGVDLALCSDAEDARYAFHDVFKTVE